MSTSHKGKFKIEVIRMPRDGVDSAKIGSSEESLINCERLFDSVPKIHKNYICVDNHETFQVKLYNANQSDTETYGAVLYLDGHRIPGKKTFTKKTCFPGFKKGSGKYQEFRFKVPKPSPGSSLLYPSPFTNAYK